MIIAGFSLSLCDVVVFLGKFACEWLHTPYRGTALQPATIMILEKETQEGGANLAAELEPSDDASGSAAG